MKKKQLIWIGIVTILIAIFLAFGLNVLFKVHTDGIFSAEWEAGDALNYVASIFGAVGTIILGYVAYKQNDRLQEMENNNYIANYSSMVLMNNIYIKQDADIPVNWEIHSEQIIKDCDWDEKTSYLGYKFTFNAKSMGNGIPALIHIKDCNIFCSEENNENMSSHLFGKNYSNVYSRIAIHQDGNIKFGMTYVIDAKKRVEFENAIKQSAYRNSDFIKENKIIWRERKQGLDDIYTEYENLKKIYGTDYEQMTKEMKLWYKNLPDGHPAKDHSHYNRVDGKGVYFPDNISWPGGGGPKYEVLHPVTHKPVKVPSRGWLTNERTMKEWIEQGRVEFGKDENGVPTLKSYLKDREYTVPYSVFYKDGRAASKRLATLMGDKVFENPKDEEIIERLIEFCGVSDDDYILDFFSGSGTTAHATFLANIMQQKNRHFILVQIPEEISEKNATSEKSKKVAKSAINLCDNLGVAHTICEIGKERIRRSARKISEDYPDAVFDGGFRVLKCDSSNMKDIYYNPSETQQSLFDTYADNIKEDRTPEDLLFQVMLDLGVLLSSKIEKTTIAGKQVFNVADGFLIACFDNDVTEETVKAVAEKKPYYAVFRDSSMANDSVATNFDQIFASISPDTVRKVL